MQEGGFIYMLKEETDWSDDFNPFIDMQRKHDREQGLAQPLFPKEKSLAVSEREVMLSETSSTTSSIKYKLFKAALRKNLMKMNLFKSKSTGVPQALASTTRRHWCDIDDEDDYNQDIKIGLDQSPSAELNSV